MNKVDFLKGLVAGMLISMVLSFGFFNYYVGKKIEDTKKEAQEGIEKMKEVWKEEWEQDFIKASEYAKEKATESGKGLLNTVAERVKKHLQDEEPPVDSTVTN